MNIPSNFISIASEYFDSVGRGIDWDDDEEGYEALEPEYDLIQKILTCEVSYYLLRRTSGICGSLCDQMLGIKRELIKKYEEEFKTEYTYPNSEIDF